VWFEVKKIKNGEYVYLFDTCGFQHYVGPINHQSLSICFQMIGFNDLQEEVKKIRKTLERRGLGEYIETGLKAYSRGINAKQSSDPRINTEIDRISCRIEVLKALFEPLLDELPKDVARRLAKMKYNHLSDEIKVKLLEEMRPYG